MKKRIYFNTHKDEIINFKIKKKLIDKKYKYIHKNWFYNLFSFITYRLIATPICWIYLKLSHIKFRNKKVLKQVKCGYFVYANHTNQFSDGISPSFLCFPKKAHIIVNSDNIFMPILGKIVRMCGALPLPDTLQATKNFMFALKHILSKNLPIIIYPEANLWPYFTKIRDFDDKSFRYPVEYNTPVFVFTTIYHKRKFSKKPKIEIYVDGPICADQNLSKTEKRAQLRDFVYNTMKKRAELNTYEYVEYIKRSTHD